MPVTERQPTHDSISVVIPFRGSGLDVQRQVRAVAAQIDPSLDEVIVVLNGESPSVVEWLIDADLTGVRVVPALSRVGAAYARNVGASLAHGTILAFTDADDVVQPHWIDELRQTFASNPAIHAVIGSQRNVVLGTTPSGPYRSPVVLPDGSNLLHTNNVALRREVLGQLGGFDETLLFCEDRDLSYRFVDAGFRSVYVETVRIDRFVPVRICDVARKHANYTWWADVVNRKHGRRRRSRLLRALAALVVRLPFLVSRSKMKRAMLGSTIGVIFGESRVIVNDVSRSWTKIVRRRQRDSIPVVGGR